MSRPEFDETVRAPREQAPAAPPTPAARALAASALTPALVLALQRTAGNQAVGRMIARQTAATCSEAGEIAGRIHDALNWVNDVPAALAALRGHGAARRAEIASAFADAHGSLEDYLYDQLEQDDLVRAFALLHSETDTEPHTAMARALIPVGTRDAEVFRLLSGRPLAARRELEAAYDRCFARLGEGTLKKDLIDDLSGADEQKALALLDRDLTAADKLYFDSVGIVGTHATAVVQAIQAAWRDGSFGRLQQDWRELVMTGRGTEAPWTALDLRAAMRSELSGEDLELVEAVFTGVDQVGRQSLDPADAARDDPRLAVAEATLRAATTGGYTGAGTNEEQVNLALAEIRAVWQERIARARPPLKADLEVQWELRRQELLALLPAEMDTDGAEFKKARLLLSGALTAADELWLADLDNTSDRAVEVVTNAWRTGRIGDLAADAERDRTDAAGTVIRPRFDPLLSVPVTSGMPFRRIATLLNASNDPGQRGAERLKLELDDDDSDAALRKGYELVNGAAAELRDAAIAGYVRDRAAHAEGDTPARQFLAHIRERYENSYSCTDFTDLLDPTQDPGRLADRAQQRLDASESGALDVVLNAFVRDYEDLTGEDTRQVAVESLERLRYIAERTQAAPEELAAMAAMSGTTIAGLAEFEYGQFQARLEELRALKRTIAEGVATAVELIAEAAITIATAGTAAPAFLASLGAAVAGIAARELLLGTDYEVTSEENVQKIAVAAAQAAGSGLGGGFLKDVVGTDRMEALGRMGAVLEGVAEDVSGQLAAATVQSAFSANAPTAEDVAARALTILGSATGTAAGKWIQAGPSALLPAAQQLRANVGAGVASQLITNLSATGVTLVRDGGNLSAAEMTLTLGQTAAQSIATGFSAGLRDTAAGMMKERREAAAANGAGGGGDHDEPPPPGDHDAPPPDGPGPDPDDRPDSGPNLHDATADALAQHPPAEHDDPAFAQAREDIDRLAAAAGDETAQVYRERLDELAQRAHDGADGEELQGELESIMEDANELTQALGPGHAAPAAPAATGGGTGTRSLDEFADAPFPDPFLEAKYQAYQGPKDRVEWARHSQHSGEIGQALDHLLAPGWRGSARTGARGAAGELHVEVGPQLAEAILGLPHQDLVPAPDIPEGSLIVFKPSERTVSGDEMYVHYLNLIRHDSARQAELESLAHGWRDYGDGLRWPLDQHGDPIEVHHRKPLSIGGTDSLENYVLVPRQVHAELTDAWREIERGWRRQLFSGGRGEQRDEFAD